ncbi:MAG TPA: hypothetical protein VI299_01390, partial [Polyangiales bacterium]
AFILFRYADHLAAGLGIVFNPKGPPAEGATDFLWLVLLAGFVKLGWDVALAAALLNAAGSSLIVWLLCKLAMRHRTGFPEYGFALLAALCVPWIGGAHAGCDGFSAQLYCGLVALTFYVCTDEPALATRSAPWLAFVLGLFRPDGVVIGGGFCALLLARVVRAPALRRIFVWQLAMVISLGLAYFVWRWRYFGELLPLPLYVKSRGGRLLPGLDENVRWLKHGTGPLPLFIASAGLVVALVHKGFGLARTRLLIYGVLPMLGLLVALAFAQQTQNVDFRFQAPVLTVLLVATVALATELGASGERVRVSSLVLCLAALAPALYTGRVVWDIDYMDSFAVRFGQTLRHGSLALTEAGRIAYWTDASVHDLVGLNTRDTALRPATVAYIEALTPDVVMYHLAGTVELNELTVLGGSRESALLRIDPKSFPGATTEKYQRYLRDLGSYDALDVPQHRVAAVTLSRYLARQPDFDVYALYYGGDFRHVFAFRRDRPYSASLARLVHDAARAPYVSYAQAKQLRHEPSACRFMRWLTERVGAPVLGLPAPPDCRTHTKAGNGSGGA